MEKAQMGSKDSLDMKELDNLTSQIKEMKTSIDLARSKMNSAATEYSQRRLKRAEMKRATQLQERPYDYWPAWQKALFRSGEAVINAISNFIAWFVSKFDTLFKDASHYIVFFGVIFLLIAGTSMGLKSSPSTSTSGTSKRNQQEIEKNRVSEMTVTEKIIYYIKKFFNNVFRPDYRIRSFLNMFSKPNEARLPREKIDSGRCDNVNRIETTQEGAGGYCVAAKVPEDISWDVDVTRITDWEKLPENVKNQNSKLKIYMPYVTTTIGPEDTFYVPQCDKTYYKDENGVDVPVQLYANAGLNCERLSFSRPTYDATKDRNTTTSTYNYIG